MNKTLLFITTVVVALTNQASVFACTVSEDLNESVPLSDTRIPNEVRLQLADMVIAARRWPVPDIQAGANAYAYTRERNPAELVKTRAQSLRAYLLQLGVKPENLWVGSHILDEPSEFDRAGNPRYLQLNVTLYPICDGSCEGLCSDPRVTPNTKLIQ